MTKPPHNILRAVRARLDAHDQAEAKKRRDEQAQFDLAVEETLCYLSDCLPDMVTEALGANRSFVELPGATPAFRQACHVAGVPVEERRRADDYIVLVVPLHMLREATRAPLTDEEFRANAEMKRG